MRHIRTDIRLANTRHAGVGPNHARQPASDGAGAARPPADGAPDAEPSDDTARRLPWRWYSQAGAQRLQQFLNLQEAGPGGVRLLPALLHAVDHQLTEQDGAPRASGPAIPQSPPAAVCRERQDRRAPTRSCLQGTRRQRRG